MKGMKMSHAKIGQQRQKWLPRGVAVAIAFGLLLLAPRAALAATCTAIGTTWSSAASWSCGHVPVAADAVIIPSGISITTAGNPTVLSVTVNTGGTLALGGTLRVNGTGSFVSISGTLQTGGNTLTGNAAFTLASGGTLETTNAAGITTTGATGAIRTTGARNYNTGANYIFDRAGNQALGNGLPATVNNLTIGGSGNKTPTGNHTVTGTLTFAGTATLVLDANNLTLNGNCAGTAAVASSGGSGSTGFTYGGSGNQTVCGGSYGTNLVFSGGGTKTLAGSLTQTSGTGGRYISVVSGTTLNMAGSNLTTANGANNGGVALQVAGTLLMNTGASTLTLNGNVTNTGTISVDGSGGGCNTTQGKAAINGTGTISGGGTYWLSDVTLASTVTGTGITVYDANGTGIGFNIPGGQTSCTAAPTAVRLVSFTATVHGSRVLLRWRTAVESNNLGFRLYREAGGASSLVTPDLISGSALMVGRRTAMSGGRSYVWWDDLPDGTDPSTVRYWLVDVDLRAGPTFHGPAIPELSCEPPPEVHNTPRLRQLTEVRNAPRPRQLAEVSSTPGSRQLSALLDEWSVVPLPGTSGQGRPAGSVSHSPAPTKGTATPAQWNLTAAHSLKVGISQAGWYRVTGQDLSNHGLDKVDANRLQLFADGREVALATRGVGRGRNLSAGSTVEFYATGLDSQWTGERTYWLLAGNSAGRRVGKASAQATTAAPASFAYTVESAPKLIYFSALMNGDGDKYFGPVVSTDTTAPTTLPLEVRNGAPAGQAALDVAIQGVTDGAHVVAVLINGNPVGQVQFDGQALGTAHLLFDQATSLVEGTNQVAVVAQGGDMDFDLVRSVGLTYWRRYVADANALAMSALGGSRLVVAGFSSASVRVMDVTDPEDVSEISATVQGDGTSGYSVAANVAGTGTRNLLAFTDDAIAAPASLTTNTPSSWHLATNAASLVILTNAAVADALQPLVELRQGQGHVVDVVDVEDVYDEFSFGNKNPQALRDFLALASSTWRKRPSFVLLAGSASADPRNFMGYGDFDLVPTKFVWATYNETPSDDWFVDFNDDGLPDMAIGRLPVRDSTQAAAVVQKLIGYVGTGSADWNKTAVLVSDKATNDFDFPAASNAVAAQIPTSIFLTQIFRGDFGDDSAAHAAVVGAFNQGTLLVNYMGHGSETGWSGNLLSTDDIPGLTNGSRLPFVSSMTCWTGWFADPYGETLGDLLLRAPQGGAVAVWAGSGMTDPTGQQAMASEFMRLLFATKKSTIGEAAAQAKAATGDLDVRRTWILLGDPTTKLQ
jgi:hypothetical protein